MVDWVFNRLSVRSIKPKGRITKYRKERDRGRKKEKRKTEW